MEHAALARAAAKVLAYRAVHLHWTLRQRSAAVPPGRAYPMLPAGALERSAGFAGLRLGRGGTDHRRLLAADGVFLYRGVREGHALGAPAACKGARDCSADRDGRVFLGAAAARTCARRAL